jgi:peptidoglycan LD-endopeptidase CwlK
MRTLKLGTRGPDVSSWQTFLAGSGFYTGKIDGDFGPKTEAATKAWQASEGLKPDGVAGKLTLGRAGIAGMLTLRRLTNAEVAPAITAAAKRILKEHHRDPFGTEIPFEADGRAYVARIEEHYHKPGGPLKPWGYHHGVTVFAVVAAEQEDVEDEPLDDDDDTIPAPPPVEPAGQFHLGASSLKRLEGVHESLVRVVKRAIAISPIDFTVLEGLRSLERQKQLKASGASKTLDSRHITGHAVDIAPIVDGKVSWHWPLYFVLAKATRDAARIEGVPLEWGGCWDRQLNALSDDIEAECNGYAARARASGKSPFLDGPHFQLPRSQYK